MAKLHNTEYATFDLLAWHGRDAVKVGHNRTLTLTTTPEGRALEFRLHGHNIATLILNSAGRLSLTLDTCGYRTTTTRQAMTDAMKLFGISGGVSFAKGGFDAGVGIPCSDANHHDGAGCESWACKVHHAVKSEPSDNVIEFAFPEGFRPNL